MRSLIVLLLAGFPLVLAAAGRLDEKPAAPTEAFTGLLSLVRYDMPRGLSDGYAPTRQLAVRKKNESDAVDWPALTLNGQPIFRDKAEERVPLKLHAGGEASSPFQAGGDDVIQPGNHWFRAMEWRWGRRHIYTADKTARCANAGESMSGRYELWTFPIRVDGDGAPVVKNVVLRMSDSVIYKGDGPWRSLTLLLPASEPGRPYELSVDGRPALKFHAGLASVKLGSPRERLHAVDAMVPGDGPKIRVRALNRSEEFPNPKEWNADLVALKQPIPAAPAVQRPDSFLRYVGMEVPRSPMTVYAMQLPHGMSGGFYKQGAGGFSGSPDQYAAHLAGMGFDAVFDQANSLPPPNDPNSFENRAAALARRGVKLGLQYDNNWSRPSLQHPNLAFFSHNLPEWHGPLYRSVSLAAQRFARLPNFIGMAVGSDNAGYVSYWHWAPPIPDRPWGEAFTEFVGSAQPAMPRAASLGARELPFEYPAKETAEFLRYVSRYDATFQQYGYFAEAVRDVDPSLVFTTGSFGSSPGVGARGGWPWASAPGRVMFEGMNLQQAYDWNELHSSKPLHNVALVDRLRSYQPQRKTWALIDNFKLFFGREAFQRAYALALTRGIQGIGTNFLPGTQGELARPDVVAFEKEMHDWIHRYGGVYARTEPLPTIGVFFGHHQAVQRRVISAENPLGDQVYEGSQEGKVTEALFLCHAAGWPARVITYQELMREPLPPSMKTILLVGLDQVDPSWNWGPGLAKPLQEFLNRGGRILTDDASVCPVASTKIGLRVAAYQPQSDIDPTPLLLQRNRDNIEKLRAAMHGCSAPIVASDDPTLWAVPTQCGDTQYVTVVNQAFAEGEEAGQMVRPPDARATKAETWKTKANASVYVKPRTGTLKWSTDRPVYDVRAGRKLTPEEAAQVDLSKDAFQWYALPPVEVSKPAVTLAKSPSGFYEANVSVGTVPMSGIPVKVTVARGDESADIFAATGFPVRLPLKDTDAPGEYAVSATELLTGQSIAVSLSIQRRPDPAALDGPVNVRDASEIARFARRKNVALTVALTPDQAKDAEFLAAAKAVEDFYRSKGRIVSRGTVQPGEVVESLQPLKSPHRYPQWRTVASDLVLFGTPSTNVLLMDQARGQIFPADLRPLGAGAADVVYTRSPFVGEYDVLNIVSADAAGARGAVRRITAAQP